MRVSTQFPVAVHALMMVAAFPETRITSEIVGQSTGCNPVVIRNLFPKLKKAGLLSVKAGRGKIELTRPIGEITLWDVYTAVESEQTEEIFKLHPHASDACPVGCHIRELLVSHLDDAVAAMRRELSAVTLGMLQGELRELPPHPAAEG